jgi:hypothetical protein
MRKLLVFHEKYFNCYKNLDTSRIDLAEQFSLIEKNRLPLTKMPKLRSEVTDRQIEKILRV